MAALTDKKIIDKDTKHNLLKSPSGVKMANVEIIKLFACLEQMIASEPYRNRNVKNIEIKGRICLIGFKKYSAQLVWETKYKNTLEDSRLCLRIWKGIPSRKFCLTPYFRKPRIILERIFTFDLNQKATGEWREQGSSSAINSEKLARNCIEFLITACQG